MEGVTLIRLFAVFLAVCTLVILIYRMKKKAPR